MDSKEYKTKVYSVIKEIEVGFNPEIVNVFGSFITPLFDEESDIDIVVVSKKFRNVGFETRLRSFNNLHWKSKLPLNIFPVTPEEYNNATKYSVIGQAKLSGKELKF